MNSQDFREWLDDVFKEDIKKAKLRKVSESLGKIADKMEGWKDMDSKEKLF